MNFAIFATIMTIININVNKTRTVLLLHLADSYLFSHSVIALLSPTQCCPHGLIIWSPFWLLVEWSLYLTTMCFGQSRIPHPVKPQQPIQTHCCWHLAYAG